MSTQYDTIGTLYNDMKSLPAAKLERANVRAAIAPHIKGARVLDLACGTGYYTRALFEWGASEVVGYDISPEMIRVARLEAKGWGLAADKKCEFFVGDASEPFLVEGGPVDIVFGAWLLNYAPTAEVMTRMWTNIAKNLRPGGYFVGVTPPPQADKAATLKDIGSYGAPKLGISVHVTGEVQDGYKTHVIGHLASGTVEFDNFHLLKGIYESSARAGGMEGTFQWRPIVMPERREEAEEVSAGVDAGYWNEYWKSPHFGNCVVER